VILGEHEPDRHGREDTAATSPSPGEGPLVLIVDDSAQNLKLARDVLRAGGFRTLEAASGAEAIALASEHLPDVILMDLRLPDMDGTDATRKLGDGARTARIPVVALSSSPVAGGDWFLGAGFAGYVEKPISVREFPEQVRGYCGRGC
jgi:two-component system cell cycle response regulator DivK